MNPTSLSSQTNSIIDQASHAVDQAADLAHRGTQAVRDGASELRSKANSLGENTVSYIKDEPVKAVLIAAATGATLMALLSLISRAGHRH